ncbi:MAG: putative rane protein [Solirubrobacteraceae bacterium]|nr:putative rane protein [Solirubrobacteraceae bacterium]
MTGDAILVADLAGAAVAYALAARRVRRWPRSRTGAFLAGLAVVGLALVVLDAPAHRTLSAHMVQHLLLAFVAAPLLVCGSPLALALRATGRRARRWLASAALAHPAVGWVALPATMALTHFTGLYQAALEHPALHAAEHVAYLGAAALFWRPVLGADPVPHRPGTIGRLLYLVLAAGPLAIVGVALGSSARPWYAAYASRPGALADQHAAGAIMWVGGGLVLAALILVTTWAAVEREHRRRVAYEEAVT